MEHSKLAELQVADVVASRFHLVLKVNRYGETGRGYLPHLRTAVFRHKAAALGYGLKVWPEDFSTVKYEAPNLVNFEGFCNLRAPGTEDPTHGVLAPPESGLYVSCACPHRSPTRRVRSSNCCLIRVPALQLSQIGTFPGRYRSNSIRRASRISRASAVLSVTSTRGNSACARSLR